MEAYARPSWIAVLLFAPMWACAAPQEGGHVESDRALIRNYLAEMDRGNRTVLDEVYAPEFVLHYAGQEFTLAQTKEVAREFYAAFPNLRHSIEDLIAEGDRVAIRLTDYATHECEFQGVMQASLAWAETIYDPGLDKFPKGGFADQDLYRRRCGLSLRSPRCSNNSKPL